MRLMCLALTCLLTVLCVPRVSPGQDAANEYENVKLKRDYKVVHVFVALCDNRNQGIVPVPAALGNGQDPAGNLYWGAQFGADTFFRRSDDWTALKVVDKPPAYILARSAFRSRGPGAAVIVFMEAYDGKYMKSALREFLTAAAGGLNHRIVTLDDDGRQVRLQPWGFADLVCFVGHNGLMDVKMDDAGRPVEGAPRPESAVVLACMSRKYFLEPLRRAKCPPLVTTTKLMAPEAYTLDAIIRSWAAGDKPQITCDKAAEAYAKYQKCSLAAAKKIFVAGWGD